MSYVRGLIKKYPAVVMITDIKYAEGKRSAQIDLKICCVFTLIYNVLAHFHCL